MISTRPFIWVNITPTVINDSKIKIKAYRVTTLHRQYTSGSQWQPMTANRLDRIRIQIINLYYTNSLVVLQKSYL